MKKDKFNEKLRSYARTLSPKEGEREQIKEIYESFQDLLGDNNCIQIGSYPRFTAITHVQDLDILYFLGNWDENIHNPLDSLEELRDKIESDYSNPTDYKIKVQLQTHSVTVAYFESSEEVFSVDIVPVYIFSKNEFSEDVYKVPEVIQEKHKNRTMYYEKLSQQHGDMGWITSDPRGYIKVASEIDNATSGEFRKTSKIVKKWKNNLEDMDNELKLKSFHLEQIVTIFFQENNNLEIFDAIFKFFVELPDIINKPNQIHDRANSDKFIDDYLDKLTEVQKEKIKTARDNFLIKLERLSEEGSIEKLMEIDFTSRIASEEYLFDFKIKTLIDQGLVFKIDGNVHPLSGFLHGWLKATPLLRKNGVSSGGHRTRKIRFSIRNNETGADDYWWKVKNSDNSKDPRGEITKGGTKNGIESTAFPSRSYVECYAINNSICVAKDRVNIRIV